MKTTDTHIYFWDGIYSNWHSAPITDTDTKLKFENTEQAFMWYKAAHFNDDVTADLVVQTPNPRKVKKLGRQVKNFNEQEWIKVRLDFMVKVNMYKFTQIDEYRNELLASGDKIIVEASPLDKIWGVGLAEDDPLILDEKNWQGLNLLGISLMKVRDNLRKDNNSYVYIETKRRNNPYFIDGDAIGGC